VPDSVRAASDRLDRAATKVQHDTRGFA
jgi:hypothetical protein